MSDEQKAPEAPAEAPKATRSNPGKKSEAPKADGPKITKLPGGTIKEDY